MKALLITALIVLIAHLVMDHLEKAELRREIQQLKNNDILHRELLDHYVELINIHAENLAELNAKVMTLEQRPTVVMPVAKKAKAKKEE